MSKFHKITLGILLLLVIGLTYLEANAPQPLNWFPSYAKQDKIPLGSYVLYKTWKPELSKQLHEINIPPFKYLNESITDSLQNSTYFFLNNTISFDKSELHTMLDWVAKGNDLFIASHTFSQELLDTLQLKTQPYPLQIDTDLEYEPKTEVALVNPNLTKDTFSIPHEFQAFYFSKIDTVKSTVLGKIQLSRAKKKNTANFIKTSFGDGTIYMHTTPEAFSNYFILQQQNYKYIEHALAYIQPKNKVLWDNYYKTGKAAPQNLLYVLMNNKALRWAYYFILIAGVLFIYFEGKRKQRAIPVVTPPKNQSYAYTQTIAELYLEKKEITHLTQKKIQHFMEYIQQHYRLNSTKKDEEFFTLLAEKSGNKLETVKKLFQQIEKSQIKAGDSEVFMNLNTAIYQFKNHPDGK